MDTVCSTELKREEALVHRLDRLPSSNRWQSGGQENGVVGDHADETPDVLRADRRQPIVGQFANGLLVIRAGQCPRTRRLDRH